MFKWNFRRINRILYTILFFSFLTTLSYGHIYNIPFTQEQQKWITSQKEIKIGIQKNWIPLSYTKNNIPKGLGVDYINLINTQLQGKITIIPDTFKNNLEKLENGTLDAMIDITPTEKRKKIFSFTSEYANIPHYIVTQKNSNNKFEKIEDLEGKTIAVEKGYGIINKLKNLLKNVKFKYYNNTIDAIEALSANEADAYIGNKAVVNYILQNNFITNLQFQGKSTISRSILAFGVKKDNNILKEILQIAFERISLKDKQKIYENYVGEEKSDLVFSKLTNEEMNWIEENRTVTVGGELDWAPFDFVEDGVYKGIARDILNKISQKTTIRFDYKYGYSWKELNDKFKNGELDILPALYKNEEREIFTEFTKPYFNVKDYVFVKKGNDSINSIDDLKDKKIAIIEGYAIEQTLKDKFENIKFEYVSSLEQGLEEVLTNKADAYVDGYAVVMYYISKNLISDIIPKFSVNFYSNDLHIGINKDKKILSSIINKAMNDIPQHELQKIYLNWFNSKNEETIPLTNEEKKWIRDNPIIKVHNEKSWAPINFNKNGIPSGFSIEYMNLVAKKVGISIKYVTGEWDELLKQTYDKDLDVMLNIVKTPQREKHLLYVGDYLTNVTSIMVNKNTKDIHTIEDLRGKKVSIIKNFFYEDLIRKNYPDIEIVLVDNTIDALKAVAYGKADATIGKTIVLNYLKTTQGLTSLKLVGDLSITNPELDKLNIAVRNDAPTLQKILKKGMDSISIQEKSDLIKKWFNFDYKKLEFNKKEQDWLNKNIPIKYVYDPDWAPFEWEDEFEKHSGMLRDIINLIEDKTGINFVQESSPTWEDAVEKVKRKDALMFSGVNETKEKKEYMNFTKKNIFEAPYVLVVRNSDKTDYFKKLNEISNKKISVVNNYAIQNILKEAYPESIIYASKNTKTAFKNIQEGKYDILVVNAATAKYYINRLGYDNLRIANKTEFNLNLKIAIKKDLPIEVISIIDKALNTISEKELEEIQYKWTEVQVENKIDWILILEIIGIGLVFLLVVVYHNRKLQSLVDIKTSELKILLKSFDKNVIASKTDVNGNITYVSDAFCEISGFKREELLGHPHSVVRHVDMPKEVFKNMWDTLKAGKSWRGEVKNLKKNGGFYWVDAVVSPEYDTKNNFVGYSSIRHDITAKKEVEELTKNLEQKVEERTEELSQNKKFLDALLDSQEQMVITTNGETLQSGNKAFLNFFNIKNIDEFKEQYSCISDRFIVDKNEAYLGKYKDNLTWLEYVIQNNNSIHKVMIEKNRIKYIFTVTAATMPIGKIKSAVFTDITILEEIREEIEAIHKQTQSSIEYASLIQHSLIPSNSLFRKYFSDYLTIWHPKDIVGGDIYLFEELRNQDECILMVIDCTGHGVPGAFVTMLVKAIERHIISNIINSDEEVSPAKILSIFNRSMKHLLKQESEDSISNAGFDGGILYYNKKEKLIKFAGAETPLFYEVDGEVKIIKGCRHSIGYKKSDADFEFKDHIINVKEGMQFYLTTDGYLDQNGGEKGFPFGKKRFSQLIKDNYTLPFADQQEVLLYEMMNYQGEYERNDDMAIVGVKIKE
ncbi:transporter substrate-binding domain-containing protein [Campylobacterota bacterium DY0563]